MNVIFSSPKEPYFMFGSTENGVKSKRLNYVFLLERFYIYKRKIFFDSGLCLFEFLGDLKLRLMIEKHVFALRKLSISEKNT